MAIYKLHVSKIRNRKNISKNKDKGGKKVVTGASYKLAKVVSRARVLDGH